MKIYWDSSSLVKAAQSAECYQTLREIGGYTRSHTFTEVFSTLTGSRLGYRVDGNKTAKLIENFSMHLKVVEIPPAQVLASLANAKKFGVRGGRVHDYLHAVAALSVNCDQLYTLNAKDFKGLVEEIELVTPA